MIDPPDAAPPPYVPRVVEQAFPAYAPRVATEFRASLLQIPVFGDEHLQVQAVNLSPTTDALTVFSGSLWSDANRDVEYFNDQRTLPANGVLTTFRSPLQRGALLSFAARTDAVHAGEVWIRALISKGVVPTAFYFPRTLLQGYIGNFQDLAWPGSPIQLTTDGNGVIRYLAFTQFSPAILELTVPAQRRWRVLTGGVALIADATGGNRSVAAQVQHGPFIAFQSESSPAQPALTTRGYTLMPGLTASAVVPVTTQGIPFVPDLELVAGDVLRVRADFGAVFGGTDLFVGAGVAVREWFEP